MRVNAPHHGRNVVERRTHVRQRCHFAYLVRPVRKIAASGEARRAASEDAPAEAGNIVGKRDAEIFVPLAVIRRSRAEQPYQPIAMKEQCGARSMQPTHNCIKSLVFGSIDASVVFSTQSMLIGGLKEGECDTLFQCRVLSLQFPAPSRARRPPFGPSTTYIRGNSLTL